MTTIRTYEHSPERCGPVERTVPPATCACGSPRLTDSERIGYLMAGFVAMAQRIDDLSAVLSAVSECQDGLAQMVQEIVEQLPDDPDEGPAWEVPRFKV